MARLWALGRVGRAALGAAPVSGMGCLAIYEETGRAAGGDGVRHRTRAYSSNARQQATGTNEFETWTPPSCLQEGYAQSRETLQKNFYTRAARWTRREIHHAPANAPPTNGRSGRTGPD